MWPGPYGDWGSRKYLLASLDQSLRRMGLDYVDIFYSHRPDPETPLEETMGALDQAVRSGQGALRRHHQLPGDATVRSGCHPGGLGTPLLIHQPRYSMFDRWIEGGLLGHPGGLGIGVIVFCPLAQGVLTGKYLDGVPEGSRAAKAWIASRPTDQGPRSSRTCASWTPSPVARGQTLAQMALSWVLRDERVTSALIGASRVAQIEENLAAAQQTEFTSEELTEIDRNAVDAGVNIWAASSAG